MSAFLADLDRSPASSGPRSAAVSYAGDEAKWQAVQRREAAADGHFFYSVRTTGVFCRPSCAARPARRENVAFHDTVAAAERAGFRPCKRCRPDLPPRAEREAQLVEAAARTIEQAEEPPALEALAAAAGMSPHHFHRTFRRIVGVTPKAYAQAARQKRLQESLAAGAPVTQAFYDAGFNSSGRFYEQAPGLLGMRPGAYRRGGKGEAMRHAVGRSTLGLVLVAATGKGIAAILLGDDEANLLTDLQSRFPKAEWVAPEPGFADLVARVVRLVDDPASTAGPDLPLDIRGTAFQRRVWEALRQIPPGETASYSEIARRLGKPMAIRAVAGACAANKLAVAVPCHRAVAADGSLAGYRWGVERKRRLLAKEGAEAGA